MHIKIIKGKKYWYESVRIGKRVTSRYIGPVHPIRKSRKKEAEIEEIEREDFYIG